MTPEEQQIYAENFQAAKDLLIDIEMNTLFADRNYHAALGRLSMACEHIAKAATPVAAAAIRTELAKKQEQIQQDLKQLETERSTSGS